MTKQLLQFRMKELFSTATQCINNGQILPGLILLYSGIDILASLNRAETAAEANKKDFINWVNIYIQPDNTLGCTAIDLYAARCSILHTYTSESRMSRQKSASQVYYASGQASTDELKTKLEKASSYWITKTRDIIEKCGTSNVKEILNGNNPQLQDATRKLLDDFENNEIDDLNKIISHFSEQSIVVVGINQLFTCTFKAFEKFGNELDANPAKAELVYKRTNKFFEMHFT